MTCSHENLFWYLATNEDGWKCVDCGVKPGEPPGFSPAYDRSLLSRKVWCIVSDLHDLGAIHVSNGTDGDSLTALVAKRVRVNGAFDQYSIISTIMAFETPSHAKYWRKVSRGVLTGKDVRDRCPCGALSTSTRIGTPPVYRCNQPGCTASPDDFWADVAAKPKKRSRSTTAEKRP